MKSNFDLRKFLVENKLTDSSQKIAEMEEGFGSFLSKKENPKKAEIEAAIDDKLAKYGNSLILIQNSPEATKASLIKQAEENNWRGNVIVSKDAKTGKPFLLYKKGMTGLQNIGAAAGSTSLKYQTESVEEGIDMTINGKIVDPGSIEIDGIDLHDYPDFADAYVAFAEFEDGTPLTEEELEMLQDQYADDIHMMALDGASMSEGEEFQLAGDDTDFEEGVEMEGMWGDIWKDTMEAPLYDDEEFDTPEEDDDHYLGKKLEGEMENPELIDKVLEMISNALQVTKDKALEFLKKSVSKEDLEEYINEAKKKKKPSAGLTKKQKSAVAKKARAGEDIGKKGKGFEKVAKAAGGGEKGKKIAAAAMWKSIKRK